MTEKKTKVDRYLEAAGRPETDRPTFADLRALERLGGSGDTASASGDAGAGEPAKTTAKKKGRK